MVPITYIGKYAPKLATVSMQPVSRNGSSNLMVLARVMGSSAATLSGVRTRLMTLRVRVCLGGTMVITIG